MMSDSGLPDDVLEDLAGRLEGTCMTIVENEIERIYDDRGEPVPEYDEDYVLADLLDYSIEQCSGCGWWMESCHLACEHDVTGYCEQCRKDGECEDCKMENGD